MRETTILSLAVAVLASCAAFDPPQMPPDERWQIQEYDQLIREEQQAILEATTAEETAFHRARLDVYAARRQEILEIHQARVDEWVGKMDAIFGGPPRQCTSTTVGNTTTTQCY